MLFVLKITSSKQLIINLNRNNFKKRGARNYLKHTFVQNQCLKKVYFYYL